MIAGLLAFSLLLLIVARKEFALAFFRIIGVGSLVIWLLILFHR